MKLIYGVTEINRQKKKKLITKRQNKKLHYLIVITYIIFNNLNIVYFLIYNNINTNLNKWNTILLEKKIITIKTLITIILEYFTIYILYASTRGLIIYYSLIFKSRLLNPKMNTAFETTISIVLNRFYIINILKTKRNN